MLLLTLALAVNAQPARIIIIRHAEKPADERDPQLSEKGRERARRVVKWLTEGKVLATNGPPAALYAAAPTHHGRSIRCVQTLEPTAENLGQHIRTLYPADEYGRLAANLLRDQSLRGKNVVVCWTHDYLPALAEALGVKSKIPKWKSSDFDTAYVVTFSEGQAVLHVTDEKLTKRKK